MKRLIVYYSLTDNTKQVAETIAERLHADTLRLDTVKKMPESYVARIIVGGGQVMMNYLPKLEAYNSNLYAYDELFIATPIWNHKAAPAIKTFIKKEKIADRVTGLIFTSGSGSIDKCLVDLEKLLPNIRYHVSLLDRNNKDSNLNLAKINKFTDKVNG